MLLEIHSIFSWAALYSFLATNGAIIMWASPQAWVHAAPGVRTVSGQLPSPLTTAPRPGTPPPSQLQPRQLRSPRRPPCSVRRDRATASASAGCSSSPCHSGTAVRRTSPPASSGGACTAAAAAAAVVSGRAGGGGHRQRAGGEQSAGGVDGSGATQDQQ